MNRRATLVAAIQISAPSLFLNVLSIPVTAILIRNLGKEGYGEWMTGVSLTGLVFALFNFGYRTLFIRRIAEKSVNPINETGNQLSLRFILGIFALITSFIISILFKYSNNIILCTLFSGIAALISFISSVFVDIFQGNQNMKPLSIVNFFSGLILTISSLVVCIYGGGPVHISLAYLIGPLVSVILLFLYTQKTYFPLNFFWSKNMFIERIKESRTIGAAGIVSTLRDRADHLFIPKWIGAPSYGIFSASVGIPERLIIIPSSITDAFFSPITRASDKAIEPVKYLIVTALMACIPIMLSIFFLADIFASVLFPTNISRCAEIIRITAFSLPILALLLSMNVAMQAVKAHDDAAKASMWASLISIITSLLLIGYFGIFGAAICYITRPIFGCLACIKSFEKQFPGALRKTLTIPLAICSAIMGGFLWLGNQYLAKPIEKLTQQGPWVKQATETLPASQAILFVVEISAWILFSFVIYLVSALLLNVIPRNIIKKRLIRAS